MPWSAFHSEGVPNLKTGADLVAALYRGLLTYSAILTEKGLKDDVGQICPKSGVLPPEIGERLPDEEQALYHSYYGNDNKFGKVRVELFSFGSMR